MAVVSWRAQPSCQVRANRSAASRTSIGASSRRSSVPPALPRRRGDARQCAHGREHGRRATHRGRWSGPAGPVGTARLRLRKDTSPAEIYPAVRDVLTALDLADRAELRVGSLSGGQRKRASIAVELLTRPEVFFLDEPTSGLDPAIAAEFMRLLRRLGDSGTTVVLATHNPPDVRHCDKIAFLARDGYLAFFGTPAAACAHFATEGIEEIYELLADAGDPRAWSARFQAG